MTLNDDSNVYSRAYMKSGAVSRVVLGLLAALPLIIFAVVFGIFFYIDKTSDGGEVEGPVSVVDVEKPVEVELSPKKRPTDFFKRRATNFLKESIGSEVKISGSRKLKSDMQLFWERLLTEFPRDKAPGQWIDKVPDTQPTKPDISPQLADEVLYFDKAAVEAHWDAFCKRNPETAGYLKERITLPVKISEMPEKNLNAFILHKKRELICDKKKGVPEGYFQKMAQCLLYVDFLIARGDKAAKNSAIQILRKYMLYLTANLYIASSDISLLAHVGVEIIWPMIDVEGGVYDYSTAFYVDDGIRTRYFADNEYCKQPIYIQAIKWKINHMPLNENKRQGAYKTLAYCYSLQKDYMGVLIYQHAYRHTGSYGPVTQKVMSTSFEKLCGEERGKIEFENYMKEAEKETDNPDAKKMFARPHINQLKEEGKFVEAVVWLKRLDPDNRDEIIQEEIENLTAKIKENKVKSS